MATLDERLTTPLEAADWHAEDLRRVVVRLTDGSTLQIGTAPNRDGATALARRTAAELDAPDGEWPLVGDRLVNPEAVVSVDVVAL